VAYQKCLLSERIVFLSLGPVIATCLEFEMLPAKLQKNMYLRSKLALALMVLGAAVFYIFHPDITREGLAVGSIMVVISQCTQLLQRSFLGDEEICIPISALVFVTSVVTAIGNVAVFCGENPGVWSSHQWSSDPSIILMFALSVVSVSLLLVSWLCMLKGGSSIALSCCFCIGNVFVLTLAVAWFDDRCLSTLGAALGIVVVFSSGLWYIGEAVLLAMREADDGVPKAADDES